MTICLCQDLCDADDGFIVCTSCGVVQSEVIDTGAEWRYTNKDGSQNTKSIRGGHARPTTYKGTDKRTIQVHQWNATTVKERWAMQISIEFDKLAQDTGLSPNVTNVAALHFKSLNKIKRCSNRDGLKAACVYYACRDLNVPREKSEISKVLSLDRTVVNKGVTFFLDVMPEYRKLPPLVPEDFIARFCEMLQVPFVHEVQH